MPILLWCAFFEAMAMNHATLNSIPQGAHGKSTQSFILRIIHMGTE
jgi:hypothetical protein